MNLKRSYTSILSLVVMVRSEYPLPVVYLNAPNVDAITLNFSKDCKHQDYEALLATIQHRVQDT